MLRRLLSCAAVALVTACSTVPPVKVEDVKRDVKTVTFVQNGKQPRHVSIGMVDGKTFWAGQSVVGVPANPGSRADVQMAGQATLVSAVGGLIAKAAIDNSPEQYQRVTEHVGKSRELGLEAGRGVLPALGAAWGVPFDAARLVVLDETIAILGLPDELADKGRGGDLLLVFTLNQVSFTEKLSMGAAFSSIAKLGLGSRDVTAVLIGELSVYRRQDTGTLNRVWAQQCRTNPFEGPAVDWDAVSADPSLAKPVLDNSVAMLVAACGKAATTQLAALAP